MSDGGLRQLYKKYMPHAHWQPVETWSTGQGVPDVEYCFPGNLSGWIENKLTRGLKVVISPHQVAWLERRSRVGGRCFVAVRRRKERGVDELHLFRGSDSRLLSEEGLTISRQLALAIYAGGPARWDWRSFESLVTMDA